MEDRKEESRMDRIERNLDIFVRGVMELKDRVSELRESQKKTDEQMRRNDRKLSKKLDALMKEMGEIGHVQGEIGEDLFYRNIAYLFSGREPRFEKVLRNLKKKGRGEYDIVASGNGDVLVVEVKNKLTARQVDRFADRKLPKFKQLFPEYGDLRILGGVGSLVMKDEVAHHAERRGLYVLTQTDEGGAAIINRKDFRAKVFG